MQKACSRCGHYFYVTNRRSIMCDRCTRGEYREIRQRYIETDEERAKKGKYECAMCHKWFIPESGVPSKFCSEACKQDWRVAAKDKDGNPTTGENHCRVCKKRIPFGHMYCSSKCYDKSAEMATVVNGVRHCTVCGEKFETNGRSALTCCRECGYARSSEHSRIKADEPDAKKKAKYERMEDGRYIKACPICGVEFLTRQRQREVCSEECSMIRKRRNALKLYYKKKGNNKNE